MADPTGLGTIVQGISSGIGELRKSITDIVSMAKNKLPPEQAVEVEKIHADLQVKVNELATQADAALRQFILDFEGRAGQVPAWLLIWRSVIRPAFSTFFFVQLGGIIAYDAWRVVVQKIPMAEMLLLHMPNAWWVIMGIVVTFWFGGRVGEKLIEQITERQA